MLKIGILGGGQLGRMTLQVAYNYPIEISILEKDDNCPSASLAHQFIKGDITNFEDVYNFGQLVDIVTIEIENVNVKALKKLKKEGKKVFPNPDILEIIKDKGIQKQFYSNNNIPTSPYILMDKKGELSSLNLKFPLIQKYRVGGYDGKGVKIVNSFADLDNIPSVLEDKIDILKEVSIIIGKNKDGEIAVFPTVEQEFNAKANLVEFLFSPAQISSSIEEKAKQVAIDIVNKLNYTGILAVELFLTKDEEILVNEIAPRPHNSGHHTIEGNYISQFELFLRSICNFPLGNTATIMPAVMINLLGENGYNGKVKYQGLKDVLEMEGAYLHLYGKKESRSFRKMGHITVINPKLEVAKKNANILKSKVKVLSE